MLTKISKNGAVRRKLNHDEEERKMKLYMSQYLVIVVNVVFVQAPDQDSVCLEINVLCLFVEAMQQCNRQIVASAI